jgi:ribonuclease D
MEPSPLPVLWIDGLEDLERFVRTLRDQPRVAMDIEADSMYRYQERICLLQLSCPLGDAVVDPLALPHIDPLLRVLEDPGIEKVFHGADYDVRLLKGLAGIHPVAIFDTMVAARMLGLRRLGLADLLQERFGVRLDKRFQRADWGRRPLPSGMLRYAAEDTRHLLALRDALAEELQAEGRLEWARQEFLALAQVEPVPRIPPHALRVVGARNLDDRGRAALQALLDWRETEAERRDIPTFKVLGTSVLVELAKESPTSSEGMLRIQGITRKVLRLWGDGILAAIEQGLAGGPLPWRAPRPRRPRKIHPRSSERFLRLKAIRDRRAEEMGMDPGLLCPNSSLKALASSLPADIGARLSEVLKEWQRQILAEEVRAEIG